MTLANSVVAKLSVAFVALATAFVLAAPAQAQMSESEMQAEIARLTALIAELTASLGGGAGSSSSAVCPYTWTRSLSEGDSGMDVMKLQQFLNSDAETRVAASGVGSAGQESEYYGALTGAAVAKFQTKYRAEVLTPLGLVNATTFFGPSTRNHANLLCASAPSGDDDMMDDDSDDDDSVGSGTLGNGDGEIDSVSEVAADESNLDEGQDGGVLAFEVKIDGDVEIDRMDFFTAEDGANSDDADDYFVGASLWVDGDKVADLDVDDFDQDDYNELSLASDDYRLRFSGLGLVFEDGDEPEFQLAFEIVNNIDSADLDADWDVGLESIRYIDGQGFSDTWEDTSTPLNDVADSFGFNAEEVAELSITESSDSPDAMTLEVDTDDDSEEYDVFVFEIEEENGVDVTIEDLKLTITTSGSTTESDVVKEAILYNGSEELGSESVPNGGVVTFENIGLGIDADDTAELTVALIFKGTEDHGEGTTVSVQFTSVVDAKDENGNDEGDMTITGTPTSATSTLRSEGINIDEGDSDSASTKDTNGDTAGGEEGVFTIKFDVTAFNDDMYLPFGATTTASLDTDDAVGYRIEDSDGAEVTVNDGTGSTTAVVSSSAETSGNYYVVHSGDTESFTLKVTFDPSADGFYRAQLLGVNYNVGAAAIADSTETASPVEDYETEYVDLDA